MRKTILTLVALLGGATGIMAETLNLSVEECRRRALTTNEDVKSAQYDYDEAEMNLDIAKRSFLPTADATGLLEYIFPDMKMGTMELQMRGMYAAGINITQPIYTGGKLTAGKRLAKIGTDVARQKMRLTNAEIISNADNAYWTLMSIDGKVEMLRSYINQMDTLYAQTTNAVTAGMGTKNDLLRIEARRSEIEYNLKKALNGRDLCRMALCRVIGVDFDTQITLTDNNIRISEPGMLVNDISNRPELSMLNLSIDSN
jgi:outer membrane protein TolC